MLVKKYQGNSLDEALKAVKADLGIEAVILKTEKFSGLKGALKTNRYEVTAGIKDERGIEENLAMQEEMIQASENEKNSSSDSSVEQIEHQHEEESYLNQITYIQDKLEMQLDQQNETIAQLRSELSELKREVHSFQKSDFSLKDLKGNLRSFDLSEKLINELLHKLKFELKSHEDLSDQQVYDFLHREVEKLIKTAPAKFSCVEFKNRAVATILLSSGNSGQTSMSYKMAMLSDNPFVIQYEKRSNINSRSFQEEVLNIPSARCDSLQALISKLNEQYSLGKHVFIDLSTKNGNREEVKKIVQSIKMSFDLVEVALSLSCIHDEVYNLRECHRYGDIIDGLVASFLDMSLNLTTLANIQHQVSFPLYFFGIGSVVPKDIEEANSNRVLAEIFDV